MKKSILIGLLLLSVVSFSAQTFDDFRKEGERLMNNGDKQGALAQFKQAIALEKCTDNNTMLYTYAGLCAKAVGDFNEAKVYFEKAISGDVREPLVFSELYAIYQKEKNFVGQETICISALQLFPSLEWEYNNKLAAAYYYGKQYPKLDTLAVEILKNDSTNLKILQFYAISQQRQDKTNNALILFDKLYKADNKNMAANQFLGDYYFRIGKAKMEIVKVEYEKLKNPDRVVYSNMQKKIRAIAQEYYTKALVYMEFVQKTTPTENAKLNITTMVNMLYDN